MKIGFCNNQGIGICQRTVFQIFENLTLQIFIIWWIHKNTVKSLFTFERAKSL